MTVLRQETDADSAAIDALILAGFGATHHQRNIWRLRLGPPLRQLCFVIAETEAVSANGNLLASIRYWPVTIAGLPSLLLGPLAVQPALRGKGLGRQLVSHTLEQARRGAWPLCFISGEPGYYERFGFEKIAAGEIILPAPIEPERLHLLVLKPEILLAMPEKPWPILAETGNRQGIVA